MTIEQVERILGEPSPRLSQTQLMGIYFDPQALVRPFDLWRHRETKAVYLICAVCLNANDGVRPSEKIVVYAPFESCIQPGINWAQNLNDFLQKFEKVGEVGNEDTGR